MLLKRFAVGSLFENGTLCDGHSKCNAWSRIRREREDEVVRKVYEERLMTYRTTPYPVGGALLKLPWKVTKASPIQSRGKEGVGVSLLPTGRRLGK